MHLGHSSSSAARLAGQQPDAHEPAGSSASPTTSYLGLSFWLTKHHPGLKRSERDVYVALSQFANAGNARPTKRELRMATGLSENAVDEAVRALRRTGWLTVLTESGGKNVYRLQRGPWLDPVDPPHGLEGVPPPRTGGALKASVKADSALGNSNQLKHTQAATGARARPQAPSAAPSKPSTKTKTSAAASLAHKDPYTPECAARVAAAMAERFGPVAGRDAAQVARSEGASDEQLEGALTLTLEAKDVETPGRYFRAMVRRAKGGELEGELQRLAERREAERLRAERLARQAEADAKRLAARRKPAARAPEPPPDPSAPLDPTELEAVRALRDKLKLELVDKPRRASEQQRGGTPARVGERVAATLLSRFAPD